MPGDFIKRAATAIRENRSNNNCFVVAKRVLEATVHDEIDYTNSPRPQRPPAKPTPVKAAALA